MNVALHSNMIVIRADQKELNKYWLGGFIAACTDALLFLNRAVIVYHNEKQLDAKKEFLELACIAFAKKEQLDPSFFIKAIMCCLHYPIRIETEALPVAHKVIHVHLKVQESTKVTMTLPEKDPWFLLYMYSKLHPFVIAKSANDIELELLSIEAKSSFEKSLNRNHIFARKIHYHYNKDFLQKLFVASIEYKEIRNHDYYKTLECPYGATMEELKLSYKRLVKQYHPDIIQHLKNKDKVVLYTKKFQALQEAYEALKGA